MGSILVGYFVLVFRSWHPGRSDGLQGVRRGAGGCKFLRLPHPLIPCMQMVTVSCTSSCVRVLRCCLLLWRRVEARSHLGPPERQTARLNPLIQRVWLREIAKGFVLFVIGAYPSTTQLSHTRNHPAMDGLLHHCLREIAFDGELGEALSSETNAPDWIHDLNLAHYGGSSPFGCLNFVVWAELIKDH